MKERTKQKTVSTRNVVKQVHSTAARWLQVRSFFTHLISVHVKPQMAWRLFNRTGVECLYKVNNAEDEMNWQAILPCRVEDSVPNDRWGCHNQCDPSKEQHQDVICHIAITSRMNEIFTWSLCLEYSSRWRIAEAFFSKEIHLPPTTCSTSLPTSISLLFELSIWEIRATSGDVGAALIVEAVFEDWKVGSEVESGDPLSKDLSERCCSSAPAQSFTKNLLYGRLFVFFLRTGVTSISHCRALLLRARGRRSDAIDGRRSFDKITDVTEMIQQCTSVLFRCLFQMWFHSFLNLQHSFLNLQHHLFNILGSRDIVGIFVAHCRWWMQMLSSAWLWVVVARGQKASRIMCILSHTLQPVMYAWLSHEVPGGTLTYSRREPAGMQKMHSRRPVPDFYTTGMARKVSTARTLHLLTGGMDKCFSYVFYSILHNWHQNMHDCVETLFSTVLFCVIILRDEERNPFGVNVFDCQVSSWKALLSINVNCLADIELDVQTRSASFKKASLPCQPRTWFVYQPISSSLYLEYDSKVRHSKDSQPWIDLFTWVTVWFNSTKRWLLAVKPKRLVSAGRLPRHSTMITKNQRALVHPTGIAIEKSCISRSHR